MNVVVTSVDALVFEFAVNETIAADMFVVGSDTIATKPEYEDVRVPCLFHIFVD